MFRRLRFFYLVALTIFKKEWRKFSLVFVLLGIFLFFLFSIAPYIYSRVRQTSDKLIKPIYTEAAVGKPQTFNPVLSKTDLEKEINSLVFRGLMKTDTLGHLVPDLAESVKTNSPTEYEFTLKKDVTWQDGEKFTAKDVIYTINLIQNPVYNSDLDQSFQDVSVEAKDDYRVIFSLKEPFAPFLTTTTVGIIPEHIPLNNYRPIGTGTYRFIEVKDSMVTLEGPVNKLRFQFYPTQEAAVTALKLGEIHGLPNINLEEDLVLGKNNLSSVNKTLPLQLVTAIFNTREEIFSEKEKGLRQALSYAIDKNELLKYKNKLKGQSATNSFPYLYDFQKDQKEKYSYSIDKAASLLKTAGWELKDDGKRYRDNKKLEFSLTTIEDPVFEDTALKLKRAWEAVGAQVNIEIIAASELRNKIVPNRNFDVLLTLQELNLDQDQYVLWHTTQVGEANVSGITSPKLDKLLEDGRKASDPQVRKATYLEFTRLLLDEEPAIFLYYPNFTWIYSSRVGNVKLEKFITPEDRFANADDWVINRPLW